MFWIREEMNVIAKARKFFLNVAPTQLSSPILIRLSVGLIFLTQGIMKYTDPNLGVFRFAKRKSNVPIQVR
jgi:hypothetical protein